MSIELKVKSYCQDCPNFKPTILQSYDMDTTKCTRVVTCESNNLCNNMERYIRNRIKSEYNESTEK